MVVAATRRQVPGQQAVGPNKHAGAMPDGTALGDKDKRRTDKARQELEVSKSFAVCKLEDFELGSILGAGSFGRVHVAKHLPTGKVCAVKILSKAKIIQTKQVQHVKQERDILSTINHPHIVNLLGYFQDSKCLYLVLEYVCGGEFFTHLRNVGRLANDTARFYAAEVLLAFEYLHARDIIYRDLKPENLLLDSRGHIKIADFGFAKKIEYRTYTLCGTPDYLAPEIILNKGHGKAVDWWAFGILIYEMLAGFPPFYEEDPMRTYQRILRGEIEFPSHFSRHARDIVRSLLQADLTKRYGNLKDGVKDIKSHPWFEGVDWDGVCGAAGATTAGAAATAKDGTAAGAAAAKGGTALVPSKRTYIGRPPIRPMVTREDDTSNFDDYGDLGPIKHPFKLSRSEQEFFADFGHSC